KSGVFLNGLHEVDSYEAIQRTESLPQKNISGAACSYVLRRMGLCHFCAVDGLFQPLLFLPAGSAGTFQFFVYPVV
ncbi:hypothetical protein MR657_02250, partial [bacterium]|nr:hypothetical protein [bacterium]